MSLTETEEQRAERRAYHQGIKAGKREMIQIIEEWIKNDGGMIAVKAIREKLNSLKASL